ncbi:MAG: YceD family protein [Alphaproteobacteria bacterium]|nr:YceD family protein [Alphaproteobacteria bacterium]
METEFSRIVKAANVPPHGLHVTETANVEECQALAERYMIEAVKHFEVAADIRQWRKQGLHVKALIKADIIQTCIVTLEAMENSIEERFEVFMLPENMLASYLTKANKASKADKAGKAELIEDLDMPDLLVDGQCDIGELAAQYLSLALDPYPRKQGAQSAYLDSMTEDNDAMTEDNREQAESGAQDKSHPFAMLAKLKRK